MVGNKRKEKTVTESFEELTDKSFKTLENVIYVLKHSNTALLFSRIGLVIIGLILLSHLLKSVEVPQGYVNVAAENAKVLSEEDKEAIRKADKQYREMLTRSTPFTCERIDYSKSNLNILGGTTKRLACLTPEKGLQYFKLKVVPQGTQITIL